MQSGALHLDADLVKWRDAARGAKRRRLGDVTEQVIALLIVEDAADAAIQIIRVVNEEAAGLLGKIIQARLRIDKEIPALLNHVVDLTRVQP